MAYDEVFSAANAPYRYLEALPAGTRMTIYTKAKPATARTNEVAVIEKEDGYGDWKVISRPKTADPASLPETWPQHPGVVSANTLADTFTSDPNLWASVKPGRAR